MTSPRLRSKQRVHPTDCPQCSSLRGMNRQFFRNREREAMTMIRTWCRVCGKSSLIGVPTNYERALEVSYWIDDQVMDHEDHTETGGWGVHWRLDDVLRTAFPERHLEDTFPMPQWYPHRASLHLELPILRVIKRNGVDRIL